MDPAHVQLRSNQAPALRLVLVSSCKMTVLPHTALTGRQIRARLVLDAAVRVRLQDVGGVQRGRLHVGLDAVREDDWQVGGQRDAPQRADH